MGRFTTRLRALVLWGRSGRDLDFTYLEKDISIKSFADVRMFLFVQSLFTEVFLKFYSSCIKLVKYQRKVGDYHGDILELRNISSNQTNSKKVSGNFCKYQVSSLD